MYRAVAEDEAVVAVVVVLDGPGHVQQWAGLMSVLSMLHKASVSGWHRLARPGRWASSSSLVSTGRSPWSVRTLAMVPPVVMNRIFFLDISRLQS